MKHKEKGWTLFDLMWFIFVVFCLVQVYVVANFFFDSKLIGILCVIIVIFLVLSYPVCSYLKKRKTWIKPFSAVRRNDIDRLKTLVNEDPNTLKTTADNGETLLMYAIRKSKPEMVRWLFEQKEIQNNLYQTVQFSGSALHVAIKSNNFEAVKLMMDHNFDLAKVYEAPLSIQKYAKRYQHKQIVNYFAQKFPPSDHDVTNGL